MYSQSLMYELFLIQSKMVEILVKNVGTSLSTIPPTMIPTRYLLPFSPRIVKGPAIGFVN
jgi:hypothetical protein